MAKAPGVAAGVAGAAAVAEPGTGYPQFSPVPVPQRPLRGQTLAPVSTGAVVIETRFGVTLSPGWEQEGGGAAVPGAPHVHAEDTGMQPLSSASGIALGRRRRRKGSSPHL